MAEILKTFDNIERTFRRNKGITIAVITCSFALCAVVCVLAFTYVEKRSSQIYVVDGGKVVTAAQTDGGINIEFEIRDQVTRLHELLFNLTPNAQAIRENQDRALELSDRSVYSYIKDLQEKNYFNRIIAGNISQQMLVDSVKVDLSVYPFVVRTYARQYAMRESNISLYDFESECRVVRTDRSSRNPHGLIVENFGVVSSRLRETRKRDNYGKADL